MAPQTSDADETSNSINDSMDIDYDSIVDFQILKNTSFLIPKAKSSAQNVGNENEAYPNSTMKQMTQYVSPIPTFQVNDMYLNSQDEIHSFPNIQKPMSGQSNSLRSIDESNLRDPGDFFDFPDASESQDEPTFARRRKSTIIIESSDDENEAMYTTYLIIARHWLIHPRLPQLFLLTMT
jgi:hypothetical protein